MTVELINRIKCDTCGAEMGRTIRDGFDRPDAMREHAHLHGWTTKGDSDQCKECAS